MVLRGRVGALDSFRCVNAIEREWRWTQAQWLLFRRGWPSDVGFSAQAQTGRGIPVGGFCGCAVPQPRQRPPPRPPQPPVTSAVEEQCYLATGDPFRVGNRPNE